MDFLSRRSDAAIRKEICGIRDSYHHYWDLLAELLQNSRDAITRKRLAGAPGPFFISVAVDPATNSITVHDNGSGITRNSLIEILAPGGGDKGATGSAEVGEKGVGLTYAVFSSNAFKVTTRAENEAQTCGEVINAQKWLNNEPVERPSFTESRSEPIREDTVTILGTTYPVGTFTDITAGAVQPLAGDINIFSMAHQQIRLLLRTRTAVGVTDKIFDPNAGDQFDAYLSLHTADGISTERVDAHHIVPHKLVSESTCVDLVTARDAFVTRSDAVSRRRFLQGKTVWTTSVEHVGGWDIKVYGVMFPDNDALYDLSRDVMGVPVSDEEISEGSALLQTGIFVATKGMPTGLRLAPKPGTGRYPAYYKRCYFLVESENLKFDLGRKSLHYRHVGRLQTAVSHVFSKFEDIAQYQGSARVEPGEKQISSAERRATAQQLWTDAKALPELNEPCVRYAKHPNAQEAAVAAIFHELVGAGVLSAYKTVRTGYGERYDLHMIYVSENTALDLVGEFKFALESLIRDLSEKKKHFADIDLLIAWDADVAKLARSGFHLDISPEPQFQGVTHLLQVPLPGIEPIPVILLRTLLDRRRSTP